MTLVVPMTSGVWRSPEARPEAGMEAEIHSTASTPTPPMPGSTTRGLDSDGGAVVKDENGQEIFCVVCNDKSSGKHYGQYTCEGEAHECSVSSISPSASHGTLNPLELTCMAALAPSENC